MLIWYLGQIWFFALYLPCCSCRARLTEGTLKKLPQWLLEGKSAKAPSFTQLVWAGETVPESLQLWAKLQPHTGRGELTQAPAVPRPWHVPGLLPLVLALAWLEEQSQTRAANAALYLTFLLDSFNPGQDPCVQPQPCLWQRDWGDKTSPGG